MKLTIYLILLLGVVIGCTVNGKPMPQEETEVDNKDAIDEEDEKDDTTKKDDDDTPLKIVGEAIGGLLDLLGGVAKAAERVATDEEVQSTVSEVVDEGIKGTIELIGGAAELAQGVVDENRPLLEGLAKTIGETSGYVGGVAVKGVSDVAKAVERAQARKDKEEEEEEEE